MRYYYKDGTVVDFTGDMSQLSVSNILNTLAKERRFHNQIEWTVLHHSLACCIASGLVYPRNHLLAKHCLIHDFTEAFVRDVPTPAKTPDFLQMENEMYEKICDQLRVPKLSLEDKEELRAIDATMACLEAVYFSQSKGLVDEMLENNFEKLEFVSTAFCAHAIAEVNGYGPLTDQNGAVLTEINDRVVRVLNEGYGF